MTSRKNPLSQYKVAGSVTVMSNAMKFTLALIIHEWSDWNALVEGIEIPMDAPSVSLNLAEFKMQGSSL